MPAVLATRSKYAGGDTARASLGAAAAPREAVLAPVRRAVLHVSNAAHGTAGERDCARVILARWATDNALSDMRTMDANLSRSRLAAEIGLAALAVHDDMSADQRRAVAQWAEGVARSTVDWFAHEAGPVSARNNHRAWAALAVGTLGRLAERPELEAWAREAASIVLCSVDANGHLPLEIARGPRAVRYHVYALRPLLALRDLNTVPDAPSPCPGALARLEQSVEAMLADPSAVAALAGAEQMPPAASTPFGPALKLPRERERAVAAR